MLLLLFCRADMICFVSVGAAVLQVVGGALLLGGPEGAPPCLSGALCLPSPQYYFAYAMPAAWPNKPAWLVATILK